MRLATASGRLPPTWMLHLLMLVAAALVSTSFTVGKAIAAGLDPLLLTLVRFVLASLLFLPLVVRQNGLAKPSLRDLGRYSIISGALVVFFWLMFVALRSTTALNTSVIFTLVPGISGMYSAVVLWERLGRYRLIALALAMTGALWVIFQGDLNKLLALELGRGDLIFFVGCLFMAAYTPLVKLLHRGESMVVMTFWVMVTGSFWLLLLGLNRLTGCELAFGGPPGLGWNCLPGSLLHDNHLLPDPVFHAPARPDTGHGLQLPLSAHGPGHRLVFRPRTAAAADDHRGADYRPGHGGRAEGCAGEQEL
jgi:drug/metabolite transporter (DMT)-like permease